MQSLRIPQETTSLYFLVHIEAHEKKNHVVLELEEILKISFTTFFHKIRNRVPDKESDLPMARQQDSGESEIRSIVSWLLYTEPYEHHVPEEPGIVVPR